MDVDTINSVIVGVVAIVSASLTAILTYIFQSRDSNKKRNWIIEDQERENKQNITLNRIAEIEMLVTKTFDFAYDISKKAEFFKQSKFLPYDESEFLVTVWSGNAQLIGLGRVLDDDELIEYLDALNDNVDKFIEVYLSKTNTENDEIENKFLYAKKLGLCIRDMNEPFHKIIKRLDYLKLKALTTSKH
jgi:hypothetical protein